MNTKIDIPEVVGKRATGILSEFWRFAAKGNVFDLAVAVIVGNAFSAVVNSLVADVAMPLISIATGNIEDLSRWKYVLADDVVISYGHFIQVFLNFLIVALSIFLMFKLITVLRRRLSTQESEHPEIKPEPSDEQKVLVEIRDLLKGMKQ